MKICIVGLGEIGSAVLGSIIRSSAWAQIDMEVIGVDVDASKIKRWSAFGVSCQKDIPQADYYIVCVWNSTQVLDVLRKISQQFSGNDKPKLISIESTIDPSCIGHLKNVLNACDLEDCTVAFPHRWNPGDPEHSTFNQVRVLGGRRPEAAAKALSFYRNFMSEDLIRVTLTMESAIMSKVVENTYRYLEIVIAQELSRLCERNGLSFQEIRELANTKWNIDIREAKDGVGGKCLPKDIGLLSDFDPYCWLLKVAQLLNQDYINERQNHKVKLG